MTKRFAWPLLWKSPALLHRTDAIKFSYLKKARNVAALWLPAAAFRLYRGMLDFLSMSSIRRVAPPQP